MLPLPVRLRLKLSANLLRSIDLRREATGDQGIGASGTQHSGPRTRRAGARVDDESAVAKSP